MSFPGPPSQGAMQGEQLKMFMTPAEIHEKYQPLDADRHDVYQGTQEKSWTGSQTYTGGERYTNTTRGNFARRSSGGTRTSSSEEPESDEELWGRKLEEAQGWGDEDGYEGGLVGSASRWTGGSEHYHGGRTATSELGSRARHERAWAEPTSGGGRGSYVTADTEKYVPGNQSTLHESIGETGVQSPIRLGTQIGSMGKPQIVGGHHRLASATEHASYGNWSHQFLPVLHYPDIASAKTDPVFKYT